MKNELNLQKTLYDDQKNKIHEKSLINIAKELEQKLICKENEVLKLKENELNLKKQFYHLKKNNLSCDLNRKTQSRLTNSNLPPTKPSKLSRLCTISIVSQDNNKQENQLETIKENKKNKTNKKFSFYRSATTVLEKETQNFLIKTTKNQENPVFKNNLFEVILIFSCNIYEKYF